jgi:anthranilate phosphoribosyltransferase
MTYSQYLREIARGDHGARDLSEPEAKQLFAAMLDGGVPDLELGGMLIALRVKTESLSELLGFYGAAAERVHFLQPPKAHLRPLVVPTYSGARHQPNLLPLLLLILQRFGVPLLLHGTLEGQGRVATAYILREFGIYPHSTLVSAQKALDEEGLAFVPAAAIAPGLANLMALRSRLGLRNSAHTIVKLIDPFNGAGVRLTSASHPVYLARLREFFETLGLHALLLRGSEGEAFANPTRRPRIDHFREGVREVLFEAEVGPVRVFSGLPESVETSATAEWIRNALAGKVPIPYPIVNQLACCLYACGYTDDMNQAKAIAAVETGSLAAA